MADPYPHTFEIEIERNKLCRYFRVRAFLRWTAFFVLMSSYVGLAFGLSRQENYYFDTLDNFWLDLLVGLFYGALVGLLLSMVCYLLVSRTRARWTADSLHVSVEGPFLRIASGVFLRRDRKLHFHAIVDFAVFQGPLMRMCGIWGLTIQNVAGGQTGTINILAVKDALQTRDTLSRVDRLREDEGPE